MLVNRRLKEIGWEQMRLTVSESRALVRSFGDEQHPPRDDEADSLHERCGGWVAGLILLLDHWQPGANVTQTLPRAARPYSTTSPPRFSRRRPTQVREFLMLTALLPDFTAETAQRLTGYSGAPELLNDLVRQHHFTERRSEAADTYKYHPLFRRFLLDRAGAQLGDGELAHYRHRAAKILEDSGEVEPSLALYLTAGDTESGARVVRAHARELVAAGRIATLQELIGRLPLPDQSRDPWLLYWRGVCRLAFAPVEAKRDFEQAFVEFDRRDDATGLYLAWASIIDSIHVEWKDFTQFDRWIESLEELRRRHPAYPSRDVEMRVVFGAVCALTNRHVSHPALPVWLQRAEELLASSNNADKPVWWELQLVWYFIWVGRMDRAEAAARNVRAVRDESQVAPLLRLMRRTYLATCEWIMGDPLHALALVEEGVKIADNHDLAFGTFQLFGQGVLAGVACGDLGKAQHYLERMVLLAPETGIDGAFYPALAAMVASHLGDLELASRHVERGLSAANGCGQPFSLALSLYSAAVVSFLKRDLRGASRWLSELQALGEQKQSRAILFWVRFGEAACALEQGSVAAALPILRDALAMSRGLHGHALPWYPHAELARLYALALQHEVETAHVRELIRRFRVAAPAGTVDLTSWPFPVRVSTLGRFVVEVDGSVLEFAKKTPKKPLELLKALIALGPRGAREEKLAELLWPNSEADRAALALTTTLHRLRRLIGESAIRRREGRLTVNAEHCWVDAWILERECAALERVGNAADTKEFGTTVEQLLDLYKGPFLSGQAEAGWVLARRERLSAKFLRAMDTVSRVLLQDGEYSQAIRCLEKGVDVDPAAEGFYRSIMEAHLRQGHYAEALSAYERCRGALAAHAGLVPSSDTEAVKQQISTASTSV